MLSRGAGKGFAFDQSGNKPPSSVGNSYSFWLETYRVHFALQIAVLPFQGIKYSTQHRRTCSVCNPVGDFLSLAISDCLLPLSPLHLTACWLPAVGAEIHYRP